MPEYTDPQINAALTRIAETAVKMFDGELCHQIVTPRAWKWMWNFDSDDKWSSSDNYDVAHEPFVTTKKTLMRLQTLAPEGLRVHCLLWLPVPSPENQWTMVCWNSGTSRWWRHGRTTQIDAPPELVEAFKTGRTLTVDPAGGPILTVLAPVRDSFKEIAGIIEVSASLNEVPINW